MSTNTELGQGHPTGKTQYTIANHVENLVNLGIALAGECTKKAPNLRVVEGILNAAKCPTTPAASKGSVHYQAACLAFDSFGKMCECLVKDIEAGGAKDSDPTIYYNIIVGQQDLLEICVEVQEEFDKILLGTMTSSR